jgi:hypothetical protein
MDFRSPLLAAAFVSLCLEARAEVFYAVNQGNDSLCTIDTTNGAVTTIGPLGTNFAYGDLAYDPTTGTMYMVDGWGQGIGQPSTLFTVDLNSGLATTVGSLNTANIFALVYDPQSNKLFGAVSTIAPNGFFEIDRTTGNATFVGNPGHDLDGLTYVGSSGELVGVLAGPGTVHSIDRATGASTLVSPGGGFINNCGVAWAPSNNRMYVVDVSGNLFEFDIANAWARTTPFTLGGSFAGLALAGPAGCPTPATYCTAGTTTNGCNASIGATGTPTIGQTSGFSIGVSNVEGQKAGIVFYGIDNTGFTPTPWAVGSTSFLCVKAPTQRMTTQSSGGTAGQCNGALSIDWLAYIAANPGALGTPLSAGQEFFGQAWFRDPPAPKTTNLSNAIRWTVCP